MKAGSEIMILPKKEWQCSIPITEPVMLIGIGINKRKRKGNILNIQINCSKKMLIRKKGKVSAGQVNSNMLILTCLFISFQLWHQLPLWLLALINLGIFFQDSNLGDRIGSIATLMIAFVALIPVIRSQIPPNGHLVFIQFLVYI